MIEPDFPRELRSFIRDYIPDVDAAELLLLLAGVPDRRFGLRAIVDELRPTGTGEEAVRRHLAFFRERGLVVELREDLYQYHPVVPNIDPLVRLLIQHYKERPVSVMRTIYGVREHDASVTDRSGRQNGE